MSDVIKVLGQVLTTPSVVTDVYTVPALTSTTISTIVICNPSAIDDYFRVSIAVAGAADTYKQYIYYDLFITAYDTFASTFGITLSASDVIRVRSYSHNLIFNVFGVEIGV